MQKVHPSSFFATSLLMKVAFSDNHYLFSVRTFLVDFYHEVGMQKKVDLEQKI